MASQPLLSETVKPGDYPLGAHPLSEAGMSPLALTVPEGLSAHRLTWPYGSKYAFADAMRLTRMMNSCDKAAPSGAFFCEASGGAVADCDRGMIHHRM